MKPFREFDINDMKEFEPEAKVGLIATINPEGLPHITLITALQAKTPSQMIWAQFTEGMSKKNVRTNPHTAFLIMTLDKALWRGKATWTHLAKEGEDYEMFNKKPMFRYNAYLGIHTVYYMDLVETYGREKLPLANIVLASLLTGAAKSGAGTDAGEQILRPWGEGLFNRLSSLKFIAWVGEDGFPCITPLIQCRAADSRRLVFSTAAYGKELDAIKKGTCVAVFGLTMDMEDILIRGTFMGTRRYRGIKLGAIDIEWVYNSMPPKAGQIYPEVRLKQVVDF
ncbi:MAG: pyridoxamine 5'-phosphate oxidase family protein [Deltaproteobacteria bacterium]|nr:pyridoxamine 5'-phosphate oxidase family protein [Deltaproteobacteria bacterium]